MEILFNNILISNDLTSLILTGSISLISLSYWLYYRGYFNNFISNNNSDNIKDKNSILSDSSSDLSSIDSASTIRFEKTYIDSSTQTDSLDQINTYINSNIQTDLLDQVNSHVDSCVQVSPTFVNEDFLNNLYNTSSPVESITTINDLNFMEYMRLNSENVSNWIKGNTSEIGVNTDNITN